MTIASMQWSAECSTNDLPGGLPADDVPLDVDLGAVSKIASDILQNFNESKLVSDAIWRDWLCLTGCVRTYNSANTIASLWKKAITSKHARDFKTGKAHANRIVPGSSWVTASFTFKVLHEGLVGNCSGNMGLVPAGEGQWKLWTITTILENFEGYADPDQPAPHRQVSGEIGLEADDFQVVVVGAGQNGLGLAGRLQALGIKYVLLERLPGVGQSWITKYDTVRQHTLREYNNLPFERTWKPDDEDLLPAATVTEGFQSWSDKHNINVWTSVEIASCSWNTSSRRWTLTISRNDGSRSDDRVITCQHLALAMGAGLSVPNRPTYPVEDNFRGDLMHMKYFKNSKKWKGGSGVVIGTGTAGHDIAQDMLDNGLSSVTMIQRDKTAIYPIDWVVKGQAGLFNMNIPTHIADRIQGAGPLKPGAEILDRSMRRYREQHKASFDDLERAGFRIDNDAVLIDQIVNRYGGYYIDVGTSARIAAGDIKIKSGVPIKQFTAQGIEFVDGTEIKADLIVLATGYERDYRKQAATIVGEEIAGNLPEFWGINKDGDIRGVLKEAAPGLWLLGGTLPQARFWSRFIALQMQADLMNKPFVALTMENDALNEKVNGTVTNGAH